jgi:hypothetical protein
MEFGCLEENIKYDITEVGFLPASRETPQKMYSLVFRIVRNALFRKKLELHLGFISFSKLYRNI